MHASFSTAFRAVSPFCIAQSRSWSTHRQTDRHRPRYARYLWQQPASSNACDAGQQVNIDSAGDSDHETRQRWIRGVVRNCFILSLGDLEGSKRTFVFCRGKRESTATAGRGSDIRYFQTYSSDRWKSTCSRSLWSWLGGASGSTLPCPLTRGPFLVAYQNLTGRGCLFFTLDRSAFGILMTWLPCLHTKHLPDTPC